MIRQIITIYHICDFVKPYVYCFVGGHDRTVSVLFIHIHNSYTLPKYSSVVGQGTRLIMENPGIVLNIDDESFKKEIVIRQIERNVFIDSWLRCRIWIHNYSSI